MALSVAAVLLPAPAHGGLSTVAPAQERLDVARALAADASTRLEAAIAERAGVEQEIARTEAEIDALRARADELRARVRRRAVLLYVRIGSPWLDAVVDADNVVDARRAMHLTAAVGDHDQSAADDLRVVVRDLEMPRAELRARHAELDEIVASLEATRAELEARIERAVRASRQTTRSSNGGASAARVLFADDATWLTFRECTFSYESGGNYQIVSPDGLYHGAWQFAIGTWNAVAGRMGRDDLVGVLPSQASPEDQDAVAHTLWLESGNRPWGGRC